MANKKFIKSLVAVFILLSLTGCWDSHEIEELGMIIGTAIDKKTGMDEDQLILTNQFVIPIAEGQTGKGSGSSSQQKPFLNVTISGNSIREIVRKLTVRNSRPPYYRHLKVLVLGKKVAKDMDLQKLLDYFLRNRQLRRSVRLFIATNQARPIMKLTNEQEKIPSFELLGLTDNNYDTNEMVTDSTLGEISKYISANKSFLIQRISKWKGHAKLNGAAVFSAKREKMIGTFNESEVSSLNWILGKDKGGIVEIENGPSNIRIVYEIEKITSHIKPKIEGDDISFKVNISSEGRIVENWDVSGHTLDPKFVKKVKKAVQKKVKKNIQHVIDKMQKDLKVDVAGFGEQIRIHAPGLWDQLKSNWDNRFSEVPIKVNLDITIQSYGLQGSK
ncbi:MAG TPA: Ger(x)C family spore germination protein [Bacillales bacterium]|nr:Ger(x)C family spore germination protein [Bacillales bacterium]